MLQIYCGEPYDSAGRLVTMDAYNARAASVEEQKTRYVYGSTVNAFWQTAVIYPDSAYPTNSLTVSTLTQSGGTATATTSTSHGYAVGDWVCISGANENAYDGWFQVATVPTTTTFTYTVPSGTVSPATGNIQVRKFATSQDVTTTDYDRLGRTAVSCDQRGVTHKYVYDTAGRLSADEVTSLGDSTQNVDNLVRAIVTTYDDVSRVQKVTSYNDATARATGNIVNQTQDKYDSWGNLAQEWQSHTAGVPVDTGTTPSVQYAYSDSFGAGSGRAAPYVRLDHVTYPTTSRQVNSNYAVGVDSLMSRLSSTSDSTGTLAAYTYLGLGTVVKESHPNVTGGLNLDYDPASNNSYTGFDRFDRIVDELWKNTGGTAIDEYKYGYDRAGNRLWKQNVTATALDELYSYDAVDRLTDTKRGTLNLSNPNNPTITTTYEQTWGLDGLGNMSSVATTGQTTQSRTVNAANEITATSGIATPTYDAAGNMTSDGTYQYRYDAWNRQVRVYQSDGTTLVATYRYDGQNHRAQKVLSGGATTDFYYNSQWQLLEERISGGVTATNQYVWSPRYIDAPIVRFHDGNGDGDLLDSGDNVRYYTEDANYNVTTTITTDPVAGTTTEHIVYDSYGKATRYNSAWTTALGNLSESGPYYSGYLFDLETANYTVRHRIFSVAYATMMTTDPIHADNNLYRYCENNPLIYTDPSGLLLIDLDVPPSGKPSACLCNKVLWLMSLYSQSPGDRMLWLHWLEGNGKPLDNLSFAYFDTLKLWMDDAENMAFGAIRDLGSSLKCGETRYGSYNYIDRKAISYYVPMINEYTLKAHFTYLVTKECNASGCCSSLNVTMQASFDATDFVEFKTGASDGFAVPPYWVHDRLVKACFAGKNFNVSAHDGYTRTYASLPCK